MILKICPKQNKFSILNKSGGEENQQNNLEIDYQLAKSISEFCKYNIFIPGLDNRNCSYKIVENNNFIVECPDEYINIIKKFHKRILNAEKQYRKLKHISPFDDGSLISITDGI